MSFGDFLCTILQCLDTTYLHHSEAMYWTAVEFWINYQDVWLQRGSHSAHEKATEDKAEAVTQLTGRETLCHDAFLFNTMQLNAWCFTIKTFCSEVELGQNYNNSQKWILKCFLSHKRCLYRKWTRKLTDKDYSNVLKETMLMSVLATNAYRRLCVTLLSIYSWVTWLIPWQVLQYALSGHSGLPLALLQTLSIPFMPCHTPTNSSTNQATLSAILASLKSRMSLPPGVKCVKSNVGVNEQSGEEIRTVQTEPHLTTSCSARWQIQSDVSHTLCADSHSWVFWVREFAASASCYISQGWDIGYAVRLRLY